MTHQDNFDNEKAAENQQPGLDDLLSGYAKCICENSNPDDPEALDRCLNSVWDNIANQLDADEAEALSDYDAQSYLEFLCAYSDGQVDFSSPEVQAFEATLHKNPRAAQTIGEFCELCEMIHGYLYRLEDCCSIDVTDAVMAQLTIEEAPATTKTTRQPVSIFSRAAGVSVAAAAAVLLLVFTNPPLPQQVGSDNLAALNTTSTETTNSTQVAQAPTSQNSPSATPSTPSAEIASAASQQTSRPDSSNIPHPFSGVSRSRTGFLQISPEGEFLGMTSSVPQARQEQSGDVRLVSSFSEPASERMRTQEYQLASAPESAVAPEDIPSAEAYMMNFCQDTLPANADSTTIMFSCVGGI